MSNEDKIREALGLPSEGVITLDGESISYMPEPDEKDIRGMCEVCNDKIYHGETIVFIGDKTYHDGCEPDYANFSDVPHHKDCLCESCQSTKVKNVTKTPSFFVCPDCKLFHDDSYYGDCKDEQKKFNYANSFTRTELDKKYGSIGWKESQWDNSSTVNKAVTEYCSGKETKQSNFGYVGGTTYVSCYHSPTKVIDGKGGWAVYAGARWDCKGESGKFPLILNLSGTSVAPEHHIPVPELQKWETERTSTEIMLDWPDQGIVDFPINFWIDVRDYIKKNKMDMLLFCVGGHGRTGTAICSLLVTIGFTGEDAIKWVRKNYCKKAVESKIQEEYVHEMYKEYKELQASKKAKKAEAKNA